MRPPVVEIDRKRQVVARVLVGLAVDRLRDRVRDADVLGHHPLGVGARAQHVVESLAVGSSPRSQSAGSGVEPSTGRPGHCSNVQASWSTSVNREPGVSNRSFHSGRRPSSAASPCTLRSPQNRISSSSARHRRAPLEQLHGNLELLAADVAVLADVVQRVRLRVADHHVERSLVRLNEAA